MAPKRKAPSSENVSKKAAKSPGKLRSIQDLFSALPVSNKSSRRAPKELLGSRSSAGSGYAVNWTEAYAPKCRSQLVVHKKKVEVCDPPHTCFCWCACDMQQAGISDLCNDWLCSAGI
jgi:hypothetical protein